MKAPPPLCRHVDIGPAMGENEPTLDPYSLRADCPDCQAVGGWLVAAHKEVLAALQGKALFLPEWCKVAADCRRQLIGRTCTVKKIDHEKRRVLIYDTGNSFWVTYLTIITEWRA